MSLCLAYYHQVDLKSLCGCTKLIICYEIHQNEKLLMYFNGFKSSVNV